MSGKQFSEYVVDMAKPALRIIFILLDEVYAKYAEEFALSIVDDIEKHNLEYRPVTL